MTATPSIVTRDIHLRGAVRELLLLVKSGRCPPEVLVEGPAGTGKSFGIATLIIHLCEQFPGIRVLIVRKTLVSMRDSTLKTLEDAFPPGHPCIRRSRRLDQQPRYVFSNGSEITTAGFEDADSVEKVKSSDYDLIWGNETTQLTLNDWETAITRLRNGKLPLGQIGIADANPGSPTHWLNRRPNQYRILDGKIERDENGQPVPQMVRLHSRHEDNPSLFDATTGEYTKHGREYMSKLDSLTGVRHKRLRLGLWVQAEGAIWENFSPELHIIDSVPVDSQGKSVIEWHFAGVDWGYDRPGVILVWGVDAQRTAYLVREVYMSQRNTNWWADRAVALQHQYQIRSFVCDPSKPEAIDIFNHRLFQRGDSNCAIGGINAFETTAQIVRDRLAIGASGKPGVFFLRNALEEVDPRMVEERSATRLVQEIPEYVFREIKPGQRDKEEPAPGLDDHGCDAFRYSMAYLDYSLYEVAKPAPEPNPNTFAVRFGVDEFLERCRAGEFT